MAKTLEEVLQEYGNTKISDADLSLGRDNPAALEGILSARKEWSEATTQEQKDAAHNQAENIRKTYGNYSGGVDGMEGQYSPTYQKPQKATENSNVQALYEQFGGSNGLQYETPKGAAENSNVEALFQKYNTVYKNPAPTWTPQYEQQIQEILGSISGREGYTYDMNTDPLYQQYRDQYIREGQRAMADTAANAAALTGGYGSTYGAIAAQQQYDRYLAGLNDIMPQLEGQAYSRYMDGLDALYDQLGAYQTEEERLYGQYLDALGQYNTDRAYTYNALMDAVSQNNYENAFNRNIYESDRNYNFNAMQAAIQQNNYENEFDRGIFESDRNYNREVLENDRNFALSEQQAAVDTALAAGDYGKLAEMGYDTSYLELLKEIDTATAKAGLEKARTGSGNGGSTKPTLTYNQMIEAIEDKNLTPNVLDAYAYYMGEDYTPEFRAEDYTITNQQNEEAIYIPGLRWVSNQELKKMLESGEVVEEVNGSRITYKKAR